MRQRTKRTIHRTSEFLGRDITIAIMLLIIAAFFAFRVAQTIDQNNQILADTRTAVENSKIIIERLETLSEQNVETARDAKDTSTRNQLYLECLAAVFARHTRDNQPVVIEDLARCDTRASQFSSANSQPSEQPEEPESNDSPPTTPPSDRDGNNGSMVESIIESIRSIFNG